MDRIEMMMTRFVLLVGVMLLCGVGVGLEVRGEAGEKKKAAGARPNIVFVITDDISPDDLSIYGNTFVKTPVLDALSKKALVFDNAYLTISSCSPSRCSIVTGRYPHNTGAPELHTRLPKEQKTFVQALKKAGYFTVLSGKNHMGKASELGFDVSSDAHPAGSEKWVKHLKERPEGKPFFCWFASHDAHHGFTKTKHAPEYAADEVKTPPMLYDGPKTRKMLADFYHEVSRTDYYLGEVLKELERQGVRENTYVVYCADNGRPFPRCKTYLFESGIKTPLVIAGPGVKAGRTDSLVSSIDFSATFLALAGVKKPETVQGVSFVKVLGDHDAKTRDVAFAERNWHVYQNHARAVRTGDYLYIYNAFPNRHNVSMESSFYKYPAVEELWEMGKAGKLTVGQALTTKSSQPREMLFHVKDDPHQFKNLVGEAGEAEQLALMRKLLERWVAETGDSVPKNPTPDRQPLHTNGPRVKLVRGDFAGESKGATKVNHPGPVFVEELGSE